MAQGPPGGFWHDSRKKAGYPARVNNEETGCRSTKCDFLTFKSENH
jgi:hypothetical protein